MKFTLPHIKHSSDFGIERHPWRAVKSDPALGRRIAAAYLAAPQGSSEALPAYRAMREETWRQFDYLTGRLGVAVHVMLEDPYSEAAAMFAELRCGRLRVFSTAAGDNPHPLWSNDDNDAFRAVHDAFGHGATGRGFDRHGEEAAWRHHASMYSPLARQAVATETRGQNCALVYGPGGFPPQKLVLLPEAWS